MKNLINYFYSLIIDNYKKSNNNFTFFIKGKEYEFIPFFGDSSFLYKIYMIVNKNNYYCHEIILNKEKQIITFYNNIPYVLLKKNISIGRKTDLNEILNYNIPFYEEYEFNWKKLWTSKIDYYEYQMSQIAIKYKKLKNSFNYYIGLSETAISLLDYVETKNIKYYVCHRRIEKKQNLDSFFNPLNFVIDSKVRDIAEYIKSIYFHSEIDENIMLNYLGRLNLNYTDSLLLLARLLYPSYYFDVYDEIVQDKTSEDKIELYIKKNASFEAFIKKVYLFIKNIHRIPKIDWLDN